jgi:hypothetical protein
MGLAGAADGATRAWRGTRAANRFDADVGVMPDALITTAPLLVEDFAAAGAAWPAGWTVLGGVASATVDTTRGRLVPAVSGYSLGRMGDGAEESLRMVAVPALDANTTYAVRFRCTQSGAMAILAARIWSASTPEPSDWMLTTTDATPALQSAMGGVAVDAWNTATPGQGPPPSPIYVDDITVVAP